MKIRIFTTGGTIDKIYFDMKSEFQVGEPQIDQLLHEANISFDYETESIFRKDTKIYFRKDSLGPKPENTRYPWNRHNGRNGEEA